MLLFSFILNVNYSRAAKIVGSLGEYRNHWLGYAFHGAKANVCFQGVVHSAMSVLPAAIPREPPVMVPAHLPIQSINNTLSDLLANTNLPLLPYAANCLVDITVILLLLSLGISLPASNIHHGTSTHNIYWP